jgi:hypothetical protein
MHLAAGNGRHEICQLLAPIPTVTILTSNDEGTFLIVDLKYILNCVINCAAGHTPIDAALQSGYTKLASQMAGFGYVQQKTQVGTFVVT